MLVSKDGGQKLLRLSGRFSIWLLFFSTIVYAGTFENFKNTQITSLIVSDFFLKQSWNSYEPIEEQTRYKLNKPRKISGFKESSIKSSGPKIRIVSPKKEDYEVVKKPLDKEIVIDFFSTKIGFAIVDGLSEAEFYPQSQKGIENFFSVAVSTQHEFLINNIKRISTDMSLNDWGIYQLVSKLSQKIYDNRDNSKLFTWFVLNKLGYSVKAGIIRRHIVLLFKTDNVVYDAKSYEINGKKYYILDSSGDSGLVFTYQDEYPNAEKAFDFSLKELPKLSLNINEKELRFVESDKEYRVVYKYNKNLIDFMSTYPNVHSSVFFEAPLDYISYLSISKSLKEYLDGKKASSAINFVLHFVQKSFIYQSDEEQFKKDKPMFAQETLYYDKSDAEDRSILFAQLVKKLFGFKVLGVKYKDHMATALYIPLNGDSVKIGPRKFVIADATYINANLGQSVYKYKSETPEEFIGSQKR